MIEGIKICGNKTVSISDEKSSHVRQKEIRKSLTEPSSIYIKIVIFDEYNGHYPANIPFPIMDDKIYYKDDRLDKFYIEYIDADYTNRSYFCVNVIDNRGVDEGDLVGVDWELYKTEWQNEFMWYERFNIDIKYVSKEELNNLLINAGKAWDVYRKAINTKCKSGKV
jgi:hypothetical protein